MSDHDTDRERRPRVTAVWTAIIALAALLLAMPAARAQDPTGAADPFEGAAEDATGVAQADLMELPEREDGPGGRSDTPPGRRGRG